MAEQLLVLNEILDFSLEEDSVVVNSDDDDIPTLAAIATYMRREIKISMKMFCLHIESMNLKVTSG